MVFIIIYWLVGLALAVLQKEPEKSNREEKTIFTFLLIFIVVAWPLYVIIRLLGGRE